MKLLKKKVETKHHWFISNVSYLGNLYKFCLETLKKKKKKDNKKRPRASKTFRLLILRSNIVGKAHTTTLKSFLKPDK